LWNSEKFGDVLIFSTNDGSNNIPMIHIDDYISIITTISTSTSIPVNTFFIPAIDHHNLKLMHILKSFGQITKHYIKSITHSNAMNILLTSNNKQLDLLLKWTIDICFSNDIPILNVCNRQYINGMMECSKKIWNEFRTESILPACSMLITGPPYSSKSAIAQSLCQK
jgi:hypothetical protein